MRLLKMAAQKRLNFKWMQQNHCCRSSGKCQSITLMIKQQQKSVATLSVTLAACGVLEGWTWARPGPLIMRGAEREASGAEGFAGEQTGLGGQAGNC